MPQEQQNAIAASTNKVSVVYVNDQTGYAHICDEQARSLIQALTARVVELENFVSALANNNS